MALNQNQRDKIAIRTVLGQMGEATYPDIALRGGEGLASPLVEMVQAGEVESLDPVAGGVSRRYRLVDKQAR